MDQETTPLDTALICAAEMLRAAAQSTGEDRDLLCARAGEWLDRCADIDPSPEMRRAYQRDRAELVAGGLSTARLDVLAEEYADLVGCDPAEDLVQDAVMEARLSEEHRAIAAALGEHPASCLLPPGRPYGFA